MFGIKMSCQLCCDLARPVMQQMFYVSRVVNLRDPCCNFTQPMLRTCARWVDVWD